MLQTSSPGNSTRSAGQPAVMTMQPAAEFGDLGVSPHPAPEARECLGLRGPAWQVAYTSVHLRGIRPVGFDRHDAEA